MGTHPIFESDFDCLTEMGEAEKISSLLAVSVFLLWPLLFSSSTLFFSERQQTQLKQLGRARASIWRLDKDAAAIQGTFGGIRQRHETLKLGLHNTTSQIREMKELSRSKFIRLKGIPEEADEDTSEKILELLEYLGYQVEADEVERANRVGEKSQDKTQPRAIVVELVSFKLKQSILREAAQKLRHTPYSVLDDETFIVMDDEQIDDIPAKIGEATCGKIAMVGDPVTWKKSGRMFGYWGRDAARANQTNLFIMEHFYRNTQIVEYARMVDFIKDKPSNNYTVPYNWAGTGHVIYDGSVYYNKFNTSVVIRYSLDDRRILAERELPEAGFGNMAPYQWAGSTDIDFAADEVGLWAIYATLQNSLDIVVSQLDPVTLEVTKTFRTNWRKQWSGNAFMACGVLYVLKKYDEKYTSLNYMYNTHTEAFKFVDIPFTNKYEWNTMVDYSPVDRMIYAWDRGHQVTYNVTIDITQS